MGSLGLLFRRPDFQRNPFRAVFRRLWWRLRWMLNSKPWDLPLGTDVKIRVPRCGAGALIYYQGYSSPKIAEFVLRFLRPGSVFVDVGAHLGEYTLLAARCVRPGGEVHAFEPAPDIFKMLEHNVRSSGLDGVRLVCSAIADQDGQLTFDVNAEPSQSALRSGQAASVDRPVGVLQVPVCRFETYWKPPSKRLDLLKIDVEGAERMVLSSAEPFLNLPPDRAPTLILEFAAHNFARFGYGPEELLGFLRDRGYTTWNYLGNATFEPYPGPQGFAETVDVIVTKDEPALRRLLERPPEGAAQPAPLPK
jgi:FkbM family methyltransferase